MYNYLFILNLINVDPQLLLLAILILLQLSLYKLN